MYIRKLPLRKKPRASFKPDFIARSVKDIDFVFLKQQGITTCFLDLDGTVVDRGTFEVDAETAERLRHAELDIKIATNRPRSRDLKNLKESLHASGVVHPKGIFGKPTKRYVKSALKEYGLKQEEVIMIGDRYFQDIFGANRSGIYSLVVYKFGRSTNRPDKLISGIERVMTAKFARTYTEL